MSIFTLGHLPVLPVQVVATVVSVGEYMSTSTMQELRYTLLTDGTSDAVLLHHLTWLLRQYTERAVQSAWADLTRSPIFPRPQIQR